MGRIDDVFGMKFILPEHAGMLNKHYELLYGNFVPKPNLDEFAYEEINRVLNESYHLKKPIVADYWKHFRENVGEIRSFEGYVEKIEQSNKQIKLKNEKEDDFQWISFGDLVGAILLD